METTPVLEHNTSAKLARTYAHRLSVETGCKGVRVSNIYTPIPLYPYTLHPYTLLQTLDL
ncbi:hypothetical protein EH233_20220 [Anabaena sp. YBS01]|nr:hypothetical protein EH233_20220 [Anabaena sp. YBS01]